MLLQSLEYLLSDSVTFIFVITDHEFTINYACFVVYLVRNISMFKTVDVLILESCFAIVIFVFNLFSVATHEKRVSKLGKVEVSKEILRCRIDLS